MAGRNKKDRVSEIIISLIYIALGVDFVVGAWDMTLDILKGNFPSAAETISIAVGVFMFLAGLFALFGVQKKVCRVFGVIIFVAAIISLVFCVTGGAFSFSALLDAIVKALVAWLFIVCI